MIRDYIPSRDGPELPPHPGAPGLVTILAATALASSLTAIGYMLALYFR